MTRQRLVARRVNDHAARALLLRYITGGVGSREQFLQGAALAGDLDQADRDPDVENLVLPDEAVVPDSPAHVVRDLARFLERASHEEHAELIATQAADRVAIADGIAQDFRNLAQHAVAGQV